MLNPEQAGQIVGLPKLHVSRLLRRGKFVCRGVKVGGSWRIPRDELLEALGLGDKA